ncbi:MAG: hypothetical protein AB7N80_15035 [Bdellovibrionales bacterium]
MAKGFFSLISAFVLAVSPLAWAQENVNQESASTSEEESSPLAPQSYDGYNGEPQAAFAPVSRPRSPASVQALKLVPLKKTPASARKLKNLNVSR